MDGVKIKRVRKTRNEDVLIELGEDTDNKTKLSTAIREAVGDEGNVRQLIPPTKVEVLDLDETKLEE